jgi:hypothetical protein
MIVLALQCVLLLQVFLFSVAYVSASSRVAGKKKKRLQKTWV